MENLEQPKWYVVHTYSGYENSVETDLRNMIVLAAIYIPYMWCVLILNLLIYAYPIYKAVTFKPLPYEMKYDEMDKSRAVYTMIIIFYAVTTEKSGMLRF